MRGSGRDGDRVKVQMSTNQQREQHCVALVPAGEQGACYNSAAAPPPAAEAAAAQPRQQVAEVTP